MWTAITRRVSDSITRCELEFLARTPIDAARAAAQHLAYEECLRRLGFSVISLAPDPAFPDGLFVEDPAVVLDEIAVICRMGAVSRRGEAESIAAALAAYRPLEWIRAPARPCIAEFPGAPIRKGRGNWRKPRNGSATAWFQPPLADACT